MEKEKIDKKDHILDVAERVFADVGYDGASTRMISGEAGVNMAMLNYYFGSKEGLLLAIIERRTYTFRDLFEQSINSPDLTCWEKTEQYIDAYTERVFDNNCFQKMLYHELSIGRRGDLTDKISNIVLQNTLAFKKILKEGMEKGEFRKDMDPEMIIATLYGAKNFIINTPYISSTLLGYDVTDQDNMAKKLKPRIKEYMKNLLRFYLLEHDHTTK